MKIRHREYGEVDGVTLHPQCLNGNWEKFENGRHIRFSYVDGWAEVKEPRYVDVTASTIPMGSVLKMYFTEDDELEYTEITGLPRGNNWRKVEWFDLPENLLHDIHSMTVKGFIEYIQRFKKPCLIVEKEEG